MKSLLNWTFAVYVIGIIQGAALAADIIYSLWWPGLLPIIAIPSMAYAVAHDRQYRDREEWTITVDCSALDCAAYVTVTAPSYQKAEQLIEETLPRMGWVGNPAIPFADRTYVCFQHRPKPEPIDWFRTS